MKKEDARASESNRLDGVSRRRRARGARVSPPSRHLVADAARRRRRRIDRERFVVLGGWRETDEKKI
jgi:hypothetical protein